MGVFANTFNAIANAIKAKDGGGDMTPAQMAGRIAALDVPYYPRPWIGSGTHYWLHFNEGDDLSVQINFRITGTATVDFGDGTVMTKTDESSTVNHTYTTHGDYRIDVTGYDSISHNYRTFQFIRTGCDKLIQFETDVVSLTGNGNTGYAYVSSSEYKCDNLEYLNFTEATSLSNCVSCYARKLKILLTPKLVTYNNAFFMFSCDKWEMPNTLTTLNETNSSGLLISQSLQNLKKITLSSALTSLPAYFLRNGMITEITIPNSITSVGSNFLIGCSYLKRCVIPSGLTALPGEALRVCSSLLYLDLPAGWEGTTSVWAFYGLTTIQTIVIRATTPPPLSGSQNFGAINSSVKFYVPQGCVPAYEAANLWSAFTGKFYELDANGNVPAS